MATVKHDHLALQVNSPGCRDALCMPISSLVNKATASENSIELQFADRVTFQFDMAALRHQEGDRVAFRRRKGEWSFW